MSQSTGLLTLRCPVTGRDYDVGVQMDPASFGSLPEMPMAAQCPHCGQEHRWQPSEARLKRDDITIAHRRVA